MSVLAARAMADRLTVPFAPGADTLALDLGGGDGSQSSVAAYSFDEHRARFDRTPEPRYILVIKRDIAAATQVVMDYTAGAASRSVALQVPAGTPAGVSFAISLGADEGIAAVLNKVSVLPAVSSGTVGDWFGITALLGNMAKLLWVAGWERDHIRRQAEITAAHRLLAFASGQSLDRLGIDLGVPRFPPLPYGFETDTVALYHFDDRPASGQAEVAAAVDAMARYGGTDHSAVNAGALAASGAAGRFGAGFAFRDPNAVLQIADHADFALEAGDSFTIEFFIKPDAAVGEGVILAKYADPENPALPGWSLALGEFQRGIASSIRLLLSDGAGQVTLFLDETLPSDRFRHVVAAIDRMSGEARLYLDGVVRAKAGLARLGALTNAEPVQIGRAGVSAFRGVLDELRFSRVARTAFNPVLGESDDSYRRRLNLFRKWTLPTPGSLQAILNTLAGPIGGDPSPLLVDDTNANLQEATLALSIDPVALKPGVCMDARGNLRASEADVCGTAAQDASFDPLWLLTVNDPRAQFAPPPDRILAAGERPPDPRRMHRSLAYYLSRLLDLVAAQPGQTTVLSAFDPRADDLRAVGRGLLLSHSTLTIGQLAAQAHRSGFDFTCVKQFEAAVYVSVPMGDLLDVAVSPGGSATGGGGIDLFTGETLILSVQPPPPAGAVIRWQILSCGPGQAGFVGRADVSPVTIKALAPGDLAVKAEVTYNHRTVAGSQFVRAGIADLADNTSIGDDGALGVAEAIAGTPDAEVHPAYLVTFDDARASFANVNARRMQPVAARVLTRLLDLISARGAGGTLQVTQGFIPGAADLTGVGRGITVQHATLPAGTLGALCHTAGFTFVSRQGSAITLRQGAGALVEVHGPDRLAEGASATFTMTPRAAPADIAFAGGRIVTANSASDTLSELSAADGTVLQCIKVGWNPVSVVLSPDGKRAYTADSKGSTVTAVDLAQGQILKTIPVAGAPVALAHHPTQQRLYVAARDAKAITEIDTAALNALGTVAVAGSPISLAVSPNGAQVWATLAQIRQIQPFKTGPLAAAATIALPAPPAGFTIAAQDPPQGIAFAPGGAQVYILLCDARANAPSIGRLVVMNAATHAVTATFDIGSQPLVVTVSPDGAAVYVSDGEPRNERILLRNADGTEAAAPGSIRVPGRPVGLAAEGPRVYAACFDTDLVSVVTGAPTGAPEIGLNTTWRLGSGLGEAFSWSLHAEGGAATRLAGTSSPTVSLTADLAGTALVRALTRPPGKGAPYTFVVRLNPALSADLNVTIRKDQYDLLMNALNALHPVGIEVDTLAIRQRVVEVRDQLLNAFPDYTYPNFRVRAASLGRPPKE